MAAHEAAVPPETKGKKKRNRKNKPPMSERSATTIFVQNLGYDVTTETLTDMFSNVGPVKHCFLVTEKGSKKSRGFGYVTFAMPADATSAVEEYNGKSVGGRVVKAEFAKRKPGKEEGDDAASEKKKSKTSTKEEGAGDEAEGADAAEESGAEKKEKKKKKRTEGEADAAAAEASEDRSKNSAKGEKKDGKKEKASKKDATTEAGAKAGEKQWSRNKTRARTVVIEGLATAGVTVAKLRGAALRLGQIKEVVYPVPGAPQTGHVVFMNIDHARAAVTKFDSKPLLGAPSVHAYLELDPTRKSSKKTPAAAVSDSKSAGKKGRLIVRNLDFKVNGKKLRQAFEACGQITEATIPLLPDGKKRGFGFVQFANIADAQKAVETMNEAAILGRKVAVDWAHSKERYEAALKGASEPKGDTSAADEGIAKKSKKENEAPITKKKVEVAKEEEAEEAEAAEEEEEEEVEKMDEEKDQDLEEDMENGEDAAGAEDEEAEDEAEEEEKEPEDLGGTVFIRNMPFETTNADLSKRFAEFGKVVFARVVKNKLTDMPQGTAFVKFEKAEAARQAIARAAEGDWEHDSLDQHGTLITRTLANGTGDRGIVLNGRRLEVFEAVDKSKAKHLEQLHQEGKRKTTQDKRNLYLSREGDILPDTPAAEGVSESDMQKRADSQRMKQARLKNPNYFISDSRLSIRNVPATKTEKDLKADILKEMFGKLPPRKVIKQIKLVRDENTKDGGAPRSKGYGFIQFENHQDALKCLRSINNNPKFYSPAKRLIVEFAVENMRLFKAHQESQRRGAIAREKAARRAQEAEGKTEAEGEPVTGKRKRDDAGEEAEGDQGPEKKKKKKEGRRQRQKRNQETQAAEGTSAASAPSEDEAPKPKARAKVVTSTGVTILAENAPAQPKTALAKLAEKGLKVGGRLFPAPKKEKRKAEAGDDDRRPAKRRKTAAEQAPVQEEREHEQRDGEIDSILGPRPPKGNQPLSKKKKKPKKVDPETRTFERMVSHYKNRLGESVVEGGSRWFE